MPNPHPMPINEAEGVIVPFYNGQRSQIDKWTFVGNDAARSKLMQAFHAVTIAWQRGGGATVCKLSREVDVDVAGYDTIILCITMASTVCATLRATVDGNPVTLIDSVRGEDNSSEIEAPIGGDRITHFELELVDDGEIPSNAQLFWIGAADTARRDAMHARPNPFKGSWDDMVLPAGEPVSFEPALGLFFDAADLPRLRAKAQREPYRSFMKRMRELAESFLDLEPWRGVGPYPNMLKPRCYRLRGTTHIDLLAMKIGAFVGIIEQDERLIRMAADHALALCHCDHWRHEFMATLPGSSWEQRAFNEYRYAHSAIFAWDWAGSVITGPGRELLAQAVSTKALPWILQTLMRHPYVRGCNQGSYFSWGAIICEIALAKIYPLADELLDAAVKAMDETVVNYFKPDGGAYEGPGYVTSTAGHAVCAYHLVARHRGVNPADLMPPPLKNVPNYVMTMASTVAPYGMCINTADGGRPHITVYDEALGGLLGAIDHDGIAGLLSGMLGQNVNKKENEATPGTMLNLVFGPDELPEPHASPPVFHVLEDTGMLCSCRPTDAGPVRLQLIGACARAGHAHDDRGSFVLEAFGEEIAIDRGQMNYSDPRCMTLKFARYHNLLIPEADDELLPRQLNPCPDATIPQGRGDERMLRASIDVTAAWGDITTRCVRRVESDVPTDFTVIDEVALPAARRATFNLHSRFAWTKTDRGWETTGDRARLIVTPRWQHERESGDEDFIEGNLKPVYHLMLVAPAAASHELHTQLIVEPV